MTADRTAELEQIIGYQFKDKLLLRQAVTHSSFANEQKINRYPNYERLEFLGDAVLELITSQFFFETYPDMAEGQMTKLRSAAVCEPSLAHCARDIGLGAYILMGRGEENTGGRKRDSIIADVIEAIIGAMYLDGGLEVARCFINKYILFGLEDRQLFHDSKSMIQEYVQQEGIGSLRYELVAETGPEHAKEFYVELYLQNEKKGTGIGKNKKAAEQQAAYHALLKIRDQKDGTDRSESCADHI